MWWRAWTLLLLLLLLCCSGGVQPAGAELARLELSAQPWWRLSNRNGSVSLRVRSLPAHALGVLAAAGVVVEDPLFRYGELETRWVADDAWNFTLVWPGASHASLAGCRQLMLVLHGVDTVGSVVLNGRHVLEPHNAHRAWWVPINGSDILRDGANMLSVVLQPAAAVAARAQATYPYAVPTMQVPGGAGPYNFIRKPAADFGWDWGPAFVPAGITGAIELVGFQRATLIGALVSQQFNASSACFELTVTGQFVVPSGGDAGQLHVTLAALDIQQEQHVRLRPTRVGGNPMQALASLLVRVPAADVQLWQPLTLQPAGKQRALYDVAVMFTPDDDADHHHGGSSLGGGGDDQDTCRSPASTRATAAAGAAGAAAGAGAGAAAANKDDPYALTSTVVRRVGFRTIELVQQPLPAAAAELLPHTTRAGHAQQASTAAAAAATAAAQHGGSDAGESFFLRVNGRPLFAKGANLIPLHVLSTAVQDGDVAGLLAAAVASNMNMVRVWGGGSYPVDELYETADELGLLVWQEAMFSCSPYPRHGEFLDDVHAEVTQQLLRVGSHASLAVLGGNNEVEQSLTWFAESRDNPALFAVDYTALFTDTVGSIVQQLLPATPWVDSSPSKGSVQLQRQPGSNDQPGTAAAAPAASAADASGFVLQASSPAPPAAAVAVKRWGDTNDPRYGDVHYYNYLDDCQDWRTYPAARFVSEYGWQSYPAWATYAAATGPDDLSLTSDMTAFRQRHPNGTRELLAQLHRRFRLPPAWLDLLHQRGERQQQQQQAATSRQGNEAAASSASPVAQRLRRRLQHSVAAAQRALQGWTSPSKPRLPPQPSTHDGRAGLVVAGSSPRRRRSSSATLSGSSTSGQHGGPAGAAPAATGSTPAAAAEGGDMRALIYLTQLQQALCYEAALGVWRRLRSDPAVLSAGVLYWQLSDVWAGASWSGIDYGGIWKPVQYSIAAAFADVALSVQHTLGAGGGDGDSVAVHVVSDLQQEQRVTLLVRLLSLTDTSEVCGSSGRHHTPAAARGGGYARFSHSVRATAPPGTAAQLWSTTVAQLLDKAAGGCRPSSCYLHLLLSAEGQPEQEATVWLAPFSELQLQAPGLQLSVVPDSNSPLTAAADAAGSQSSSQSSSSRKSPGNAAPPAHKQHPPAAFAVSSQAVAVYAVWELSGGQPPGHFSHNALTIHPCEPRNVTWLPTQAAARPAPAGCGRGVFPDRPRRGAVQWQQLRELLQQQLVVTSLWDHQAPPAAEPLLAEA